TSLRPARRDRGAMSPSQRDPRHSPPDPGAPAYFLGSRCSRKSPHQARSVDTPARGAEQPFGRRLAARPGMATSLDDMEHPVRVARAARVFEARDIRRDLRFDGVRSAAVSSSPIDLPCGDTLKWYGFPSDESRGDAKDVPPSYGASGSAVPRNEITGIGRE